ncbi:MAG: hypothetical protein B6I38_08085 [Anaerolineaceae bacterium 4572_5.1]|nr:MAG: hypothetical protein B6I38_08085 [Anaerolineaceae bacterium 4572_5.1]
MAHILIVDDELSIRITFSEFLRSEDYEVEVAEDADQAMKMLSTEDFDVVVTDIVMPRITGVKLLEAIRKSAPRVQVILMTGEPTVETASKAVRADAFDYLTKPISKSELVRTVANAVKVKTLDDERRRLAEENLRYQENLEQLVDERTKALQESEGKLRNIVENSTNLFYSHTSDHQLTYLSPQSREFLQCEPEEAMIKWYEFATDNLINEKGFALTKKAIETGKRQPPYELELIGKKGKIIRVEVRETPIVQKNKTIGIVGSLTDITERVQAAEALQRKHRELTLLNRIIAATGTTLNSKKVLATICRELALAFDVPQAAAALLDKTRTTATVVAEYLAEGRPSAMDIELPVEGNFATQYVIEHKAPLSIVDAQHDPRFANIHEKVKKRGTVSMLLLPLLTHGEVVGTLGLDTIERHEFSSEEINLAVNAVAATSQALENARLYQTVQHELGERVRAEKALQKSEEKFRAIYNNSPDMYVSVSPNDDSILLCNETLLRETGYSKEEIIGAPIYKLYHDDCLEDVKKVFQQFAKTGKIQDEELILKRKDGSKIEVNLKVDAVRDSTGKIRYSISSWRDITERKEARQTLKKYASRLETLNTVTAALSTSLELDDVLNLILDQVGKVIPFDSGAVFLREKDGVRVALDRGITPSGKGRIFPSENELFKEIQETGKTLIVDNVNDDPRFENWGKSKNLKSWMGVPLIARDTLVGLLTLDSLQPEAYSPEQADLAQTFAAQAAQAIENARQFSSAQRRMGWLNALHKIDQAITGSFDLKLTLNILLGQLLEQLNVDAAAALLYEGNLQTLTFAYGRGFHTTALQHTKLRLGQGHAGKAALQRRPIFIPDLRQPGTSFLESPAFKEEGFVAYHGIPLLVKGVLVGVLEVFHRSPLNRGNEWDEFLNTLARQAAIAIDNITLFNELQRSNINLLQAYDATIEGWATALELRDMETVGHSRRVVKITTDMAQILKFPDEELIHIRRGALLHDVGKMGIPDSVLQKPSKLTAEEWEIMRKHPVYAYEWLSAIEYLQPALDIPHYHHERWDGTGYPHGLDGRKIPLSARIFAIADVWDALRSDRPYRKAWSKEKTLDHIQAESGKHFDPKVVDVFLEYIRSQ